MTCERCRAWLLVGTLADAAAPPGPAADGEDAAGAGAVSDVAAPEDAGAIRAHLAECAGCAARHDRMRTAERALARHRDALAPRRSAATVARIAVAARAGHAAAHLGRGRAGTRDRLRGAVARAAVIAAGLGALWLVIPATWPTLVERVLALRPRARLESRYFALTCLSPTEAATLVAPLVERGDGAAPDLQGPDVVPNAPPDRSLIVRAPREALDSIAALLGRSDVQGAGRCRPDRGQGPRPGAVGSP